MIWWWYSPSSLWLWKLCSTARHIIEDNGCSHESIPTWAQLWGNVNDATDDEDYWYGALVGVTYQHRNGFAHNQTLYREWLKDADTISFKAPLWPCEKSLTLFLLHTFTPAYWLVVGVNSEAPLLSLQTSEMAVIKAWSAHPGILGWTWSRAAAVQGCILCIHPQRDAWNPWGPAGVLEKILFGFVVHQPEQNIIKFNSGVVGVSVGTVSRWTSLHWLSLSVYTGSTSRCNITPPSLLLSILNVWKHRFTVLFSTFHI